MQHSAEYETGLLSSEGSFVVGPTVVMARCYKVLWKAVNYIKATGRSHTEGAWRPTGHPLFHEYSFIYPDDADCRFVSSICSYLPDYTTSHPRCYLLIALQLMLRSKEPRAFYLGTIRHSAWYSPFLKQKRIVRDCSLDDLLSAVKCEIAYLPFSPHICGVYCSNLWCWACHWPPGRPVAVSRVSHCRA
jgi:hypothetical protein